MTNDFMFSTKPYLIQDSTPSPLTLPSDEGLTSISSLSNGFDSPTRNDTESDSTVSIDFFMPTLPLRLFNEMFTVSLDSQDFRNNSETVDDIEEIEPIFGLFHSTRIPFKVIGGLYIIGLSFAILNSIPKTHNENFTLISVLLNGIASMLLLTKLYLKRQEDQADFQRNMRSPV